MARIRNIKPAFFRHEHLQDLEADYPGNHIMLVYIALWTQCDAAGIFPWKPRTLKLDILPFIDYNLEETLRILVENGYIQQYEAQGAMWGFIPTFSEHQRITGKESTEGEKHPKPGENRQGNTRETPVKYPDAQGEERITGKDNREGVFPHAHEAAPAGNFPEKNEPVIDNIPLGEFATIYQSIIAWGESDTGHAEIVTWKKITGYRDSQHGATTDEVSKFVSYHLGQKTSEENRSAFIADPIRYFQAKFPGWLTNAKSMNRPPKSRGKPLANARDYIPPRRPGGQSEPTAITNILQKNLTP